MLSYEDALARILDAIPSSLDAETIPLADAVGRALVVPIFAQEDVPRFANSAVDGYAVHAADLLGVTEGAPVELPVVRTIAAGSAAGPALNLGEAVRILTGAPLPGGANAIVMVEDTQRLRDSGSAERVRFNIEGSASYVRAAGSDMPKGWKAVDAGTSVDPGIVGLLAALNVTEVNSSRRPRVGLIITGNEVVPAGVGELAVSQIRDANGPALAAAIREADAELTVTAYATDSAEDTRSAILKCLESCDIIVSTGGVSVGEFDFVKATVEQLGTLDFWRVAIKPGKPLAFGRIGRALFFGLPGNPVSSLVTFELFVRPVLRKLSGFSEIYRRKVTAKLADDLPHERGRREFVRAAVTWHESEFLARPTGTQTSHRLSSLVGANAYVIASEDHGDYAAGAILPAMLLNF